MELKRYLKIGLRWWWLMLFSVALSATASYIYSQRQPRIYAAKSSLMVGTSVVQTLNPDEHALGLSRTLAEVYGELARRRVITQAVIDRLGLDMDPDQLSSMINTAVIPSAQLLEIFVLDIHPRRAQVLANAIAEELILQSPTNVQGQQEREEFINAQLEELQVKIQETNRKIKAQEDALASLTSAVEIAEAQSQLVGLEELRSDYQSSFNQFLANLSESSPNRLTLFESATEPTSPISPDVKMNVAIAAAAGLALAISAIVLLEFFDDALVWRREDPQIVPGVPVLGTVSKVSDGAGKLITHNEMWSPEADELRNLRSSIFLATANQTLSTLLITSPSQGEGKSYVSANLAATIASPGSSVAAIIASVGPKVILIDADLRKPTLHEVFDIPNLLGLVDVLSLPEDAIEAVLKKALRPINIDNLLLLPAGRTPLDPGSLLTSPRFPKAIHFLSTQADLVIIDSPPILETVDAKAIANVVDGVLLVVSNGQTSSKMAQKAIDYFQSMPNNNLLGGVFNRVKLLPSYNYYTAYAPQPNLQKRPKSAGRSVIGRVLWPFTRPQRDETTAFTLAEVADYLGVSQDTARRWCQQGRIPAIKTGRRWSVRQEDLNEFIAVYQGSAIAKDKQLPESAAPAGDDGDSPNGLSYEQKLSKISS